MTASLAACGGSGSSSAAASGSSSASASGSAAAASDYRVAMITDYGDITDQSFNQTTYEACKQFCESNTVNFTYYKPAGDSTADRVAMACGEHPQAADSVGINVYKMRYAGVLISGMLGGLGGIVYITAGVSEWKFETGAAGFGFLALAVMIFGQWRPTRIALAALLFGLFRALSNVYTGFDFLVALNLPSGVYNMLPYIISLVVLAFTSSKSRAPKAEGIPYDKGQR